MVILFWGITLSVFGKLLLAAGVLLAHRQIEHEHRIDQKVLISFRNERFLTIIGIVLILIGYALEIYFYGFTPFTECAFGNCSASLPAGFSQ